MTIYLDYIFIENFFIDYILLKETSYITKKETTHSRTIISAIIASSYVVIMTYFRVQEFNYLICKLLLVVVMVYISFQPKTLNEYIKIIGLFFLISAINVGTLIIATNLLNLQNSNVLVKLIIYIFSFILSKFFTNHMWKLYKREIKNDDLIYEVKIHLGEQIYKYNAFLDTGNNVYSYIYNVPVIFAEILDDNMLTKLKDNKESFSIRTVTLASESDKKAYIFDDVEITKKQKTWHIKAAVVFEKTSLSKDGSYNMLLNYILYTQNLGGIKI